MLSVFSSKLSCWPKPLLLQWPPLFPQQEPILGPYLLPLSFSYLLKTFQDGIGTRGAEEWESSCLSSQHLNSKTESIQKTWNVQDRNWQHSPKMHEAVIILCTIIIRSSPNIKLTRPITYLKNMRTSWRWISFYATKKESTFVSSCTSWFAKITHVLDHKDEVKIKEKVMSISIDEGKLSLYMAFKNCFW